MDHALRAAKKKERVEMHKNSRYALATTHGELKMDKGFIDQVEELRQCFPVWTTKGTGVRHRAGFRLQGKSDGGTGVGNRKLHYVYRVSQMVVAVAKVLGT